MFRNSLEYSLDLRKLNRKRWEDNIKEWTGLEWNIILRKAENREEWRKLVVKSTGVPQRSARLRDRKDKKEAEANNSKHKQWVEINCSAVDQATRLLITCFPSHFPLSHLQNPAPLTPHSPTGDPEGPG